ncbi:MAG: DUF533 domain-containing protein [Vicinamibacterales bacterium]
MLNNPEDMLGIVLRGVLGRSGRKRGRRATRLLSGRGGFITAGTLMTAAGVVWGIYDSLKGQNAGPAGVFNTAATAGTMPPPIPVSPPAGATPDNVLRVIRLAVSAARSDGAFGPEERAIIVARAKEAGLESAVEAELAASYSLADIVAGVTDETEKKNLYILAFTIVRADENVSGAERVYLAQLAYQLGLDAATVAQLETATATAIDAQPE